MYNTYIFVYFYIEITLEDTKLSPYCSFENSNVKKLTEIH